MRKVLRPILILLAIAFLIEAWLWDWLEPIVARVVNILPLKRVKAAVTRWVDQLPPAGTLVVFLVPMVLIVPIKIIEFWLFVNGAWLEGVGALVLAKLVFLGTTAFVFDVTRDKLLQLDWFRVLYDYVMWLRDWAHALVEPIKARIAMRLKLMTPGRLSRAWRLLRRIRQGKRAQKAGVAFRPDAQRAARTSQSP